jgi:hypothetical protein
MSLAAWTLREFVVLDTDVASASLRGCLPDQLKARLAGQSLCITFVTLGELTKWTHIGSWVPAGWRIFGTGAGARAAAGHVQNEGLRRLRFQRGAAAHRCWIGKVRPT